MTARRSVWTWTTDGSAVLYFNTILPYAALDPEKWDLGCGPHPPDRHYDVVVGQRLHGDRPEWLRLCADPSVRTLLSIDDDLTAIDPENHGPYELYSPPHVLAGTIANIAAADVVTVPHEAFADRMRLFNPNTFILPLCIPDEILDWPKPAGAGDPTVGWGGSMFAGQDWAGADLLSALTLFMEQRPAATFHTCGADYTQGRFGARTRSDPWGDLFTFYRNIDFDFGLAPLMQSPFNQLKCRTKAIQYGARGVCTIGSNLGEQATWIEDCVNGLLVPNSETLSADWLDRMLLLADDVPLRERLNAAAKEKASDAAISRNIHLWETVYS